VEGWRHDYTSQWDDSSLKTVAAFANTFGGLLIVGVKKSQKDIACEFPGVESSSEYKTRIASSIAANISPVPSFNISECNLPGTQNRRFCVIRVRPGPTLHLVTKKDFQPVYIRNEDETRPANAEQLRSLIERERNTPSRSQQMAILSAELRDAMDLNQSYRDTESDEWYRSPFRRSPFFVKIQAVPSDAIQLEIDKSIEDRLWKMVSSIYPRIHNNVVENIAKRADLRDADFHEIVTFHTNIAHENRWRVTSSGSIGHATQILHTVGDDNFWSIVDLALYMILFSRLTAKWWQSIDYFGDGILYVQISVPGLQPFRHPDGGYYIQGFDPTWSPNRIQRRLDIGRDAIHVSKSVKDSATTHVRLTNFSAQEKFSETTTTIMNRLLRSLGHRVDRERLTTYMISMIRTPK